jgi:hypothetical protein
LVGMVGSPPPLPLPSVVAPPQQLVLLSAVFARLGACLFRALHATGLPAIEVVFPAADVPLRTLELLGLCGDRVTVESLVVSPCLVVASALGSASASVSTASPGTLAAGRATDFAPPSPGCLPRRSFWLVLRHVVLARRLLTPLRCAGVVVLQRIPRGGHPLHHSRAERRDAPAWSDWRGGGARRHYLSRVLAPFCYRSLGESLSRDPSIVRGCLGRRHPGLYPRG